MFFGRYSEGISIHQVEEAYKVHPETSAKLKILDGKLYISGNGPEELAYLEEDEIGKKRLRMRLHHSIFGLLKMLEYENFLGETMFVLRLSDSPSNIEIESGLCAPVFGAAFGGNQCDLPLPPWTVWGEDLFPKRISEPPLHTMLGRLVKSQGRTDYAKRKKLFWQGSSRKGARAHYLSCAKSSRGRLYLTMKHASTGKFISPEERCEYKKILYIGGRSGETISTSLLPMLLCNSTLFKVKTQFSLYPEAFLIRNFHYFEMEPNWSCGKIIKFVKSKDSVRLGENLGKFAADMLSETNIYKYMHHMIRIYSDLAAFETQIEPGDVELNFSNFFQVLSTSKKMFSNFCCFWEDHFRECDTRACASASALI